MAKPKKIINDPTDAVGEFIQGLLLQYPTQLQRLATHHVVLAAQRAPGTVQLISGGGSGHEPSHAGWLGAGMLSAAVCGGIFASPSVAAVLAAIQALSSSTTTTSAGAKGVLLIIKNYTGDRLNFGVAAERANLLSTACPVRTIVVADDCALPRTKGVTGARGVAGTVLVHKITGAAAAAGLDLDACHAVAQRVCARMGTLGIALDTVTVPGASQVNDRLADDSTIEIGLGIHGEAGLKQSKLLTSDEMAVEMVQTIQAYGRVDENENAIVPFVNAGDEVVIPEPMYVGYLPIMQALDARVITVPLEVKSAFALDLEKIKAIRELMEHTAEFVHNQLPKTYSWELEILFKQPTAGSGTSSTQYREAPDGLDLPQAAMRGGDP